MGRRLTVVPRTWLDPLRSLQQRIGLPVRFRGPVAGRGSPKTAVALSKPFQGLVPRCLWCREAKGGGRDAAACVVPVPRLLCWWLGWRPPGAELLWTTGLVGRGGSQAVWVFGVEKATRRSRCAYYGSSERCELVWPCERTEEGRLKGLDSIMRLVTATFWHQAARAGQSKRMRNHCNNTYQKAQHKTHLSRAYGYTTIQTGTRLLI